MFYFVNLLILKKNILQQFVQLCWPTVLAKSSSEQKRWGLLIYIIHFPAKLANLYWESMKLLTCNLCYQ